MKTSDVPHTTLNVSKLCMGTMTFGSQVDEPKRAEWWIVVSTPV